MGGNDGRRRHKKARVDDSDQPSPFFVDDGLLRLELLLVLRQVLDQELLAGNKETTGNIKLEKVDQMKAKQIHEGRREPRGRGFESRCRLRIFSFRVALVRSCRVSTLHKVGYTVLLS